MKMNPLGRSDLRVSELCLGTMTWGSQNSQAEAHEQLDHAIGEGINFIDTAEMYPTTPRRGETTGLTEEIIGNWLNGRADRDRLVIATKVTGVGNQDIRNGERVTGASLRAALETSLRRLRTDHIDLYQLHWPNRGSYHFRQCWNYDPARQSPAGIEEEIADMLGAVARLQQEGKLRAFGLSNETAWGTMKWLEVARRESLPRVVSIQNEYSLLCRLFDTDLAEVAVHEQVGLLAFSPLAAGGLSGKYRHGDIPAGSRRSLQPELNDRYVPWSEQAIAAYVGVANRHGLDPARMALAFARTRSFMTSVIIGATSMEQLRNNIAAKDLTLSEEVLADIQAVRRDHPMPI
ncbi:MAG: aldo/keto reductase [Nitratireductor sp.]|nr:aldo/keto reductase [Nitratireductor sp.]